MCNALVILCVFQMRRLCTFSEFAEHTSASFNAIDVAAGEKVQPGPSGEDEAFSACDYLRYLTLTVRHNHPTGESVY